METIKAGKEKYGYKVLGGGAGAWQWIAKPKETERQGINVVFDGYFEELGPPLISDILENKSFDAIIKEPQTAIHNLRALRGASMLGVIEISRGCGKGCTFCTLAFKKMDHVPHDVILSDLERNVANGVHAVVSGSEDFFRYGAKGMNIEFEKLRELLAKMREVEGLSFMQIDHANISSVLQLSIDELKEVRRLLTWKKRTDYLWVNMGVESANGWLVHLNGHAKITPFDPDDWEEMVKETARRMTEAGFFSVFSVILGLPGETPDDVQRTIKLAKYLSTQRAVVFPIFHEPVLKDHPRGGEKFSLNNMRHDHFELYTTCYRINFNWVPKLYWDNQRAGGVSFAKRSFIQMLGKYEMMTWSKHFRIAKKKIDQRINAEGLELAYAQSAGSGKEL